MALADARPIHDPLVVGRDHLFEVLVGEHAGRRVAPSALILAFGKVVLSFKNSE